METKITGNNSVVPLNKVKDDTSVFVRLWQRGKEILTPLREILDTIAGVGSNFAPKYTKKPYKVNSYVMNDGILYTNENAIRNIQRMGTARKCDSNLVNLKEL